MNGTVHAGSGAACGFAVANFLEATPDTTLILIGLGVISALAPDLDIDGTLRGKITLSHKVTKFIAQVIGVMLIIYSLYEGTLQEKLRGVGIGALMLIFSTFIKQKHMLTITGLGVLIGGFSLSEKWMILFGVFIMVASIVSHRSYTHSLLGAVFFAFIAIELEQSLAIPGVFYTCLLGFVSHLLMDMKLLPVNKKGIKLFLPLSSKEF